MSVRETTKKKGKDYPVGPVLLGFFMFVVTGSSGLFKLFQRTGCALTSLSLGPPAVEPLQSGWTDLNRGIGPGLDFSVNLLEITLPMTIIMSASSDCILDKFSGTVWISMAFPSSETSIPALNPAADCRQNLAKATVTPLKLIRWQF
ncbi:hypothetical protein NC652_009479 [Populus alba x Populus x berolinensis]|nr:hypothetical protein NC652_009479 [Populus alba x Populus x berolinensis]